MLIRIGGGIEGIKDYLENGQKQGREFSRDELDERVILAGDLEATDAIIQRMDNDGEKYLHVTIAFKEDDISRETLQAVAREFEAFAFSAYDQDEYSFYAEAHMPKIKSYTNEQSGEFVERKPHIHVVVPKTNLLSEQHLNPFGVVEQNEKFIDAFQEHINNKFGLASPKENRRIEFTGESEMISRYKGDVFEGQNKDLKGDILETMLARKVERYDDFKAMLSEFGETRARNEGKATEYQNVKAADAGKGVLVTSMFGPSLNPNTGDWSVGCSGFWFEGGEIAWPVTEITVAGNLMDMFQRLVPGSDLEIRGSANAPSILIDGLAIAGK